MLFLTHIIYFVIQIKLQEAEKANKLSIDLTAKLNEAEIKIAEKMINNTKKNKVYEKGPRPKKTDSVQKSQPKKTGTNVGVNKRKQAPRKLPEDNAPLSDYVKMCNEKKKRNTDVLERLGLIGNKKNSATSKIKKAPERIRCTLDHKEYCTSKRKKAAERMRCTFDHGDICSYKAEDDKRYCKEGNDLYDLHCIVCNRLFAEVEVEGCIVPTRSHPLYICLGRNKYQCKRTYCFDCYQNIAVNNKPIEKRRRSNRKTPN